MTKTVVRIDADKANRDWLRTGRKPKTTKKVKAK